MNALNADDLIRVIRRAPDPCTIGLGFVTIPRGQTRALEVSGLTEPFRLYRFQASTLPPAGRVLVVALEVDGTSVDLASLPVEAKRSIRVEVRNPRAFEVVAAVSARGRWADPSMTHRQVEAMCAAIREACGAVEGGK